MRHSIKRKIALTFIGLIALALVLIAVLSYTLLPQYYTMKKSQILEESWGIINAADDINIENMSKGISVEYKHFCINNNLEYAVTSTDLTLYSSNAAEPRRLVSRIFGFDIMRDNDGSETVKSTDKYQIQKSYDQYVGLDYLELWGKLDNGGYYIVRMPLESITDATQISNQFYLFVGLGVLALGVVVILFLTNKIVKPLQELTMISKRMASLDFDAKYESGGADEIGELGNNFNIMSGKLEKAITELKTANVELQNDIREKVQVDEMRKEFLSNVTHELKTPIALIQGYAEGLKDCINDDEESRDFYCDVIIDESGKMNEMVKKLLNLNQLEFGSDQVSMTRFDLVELIQGVLQSSHILIEQKEARVIFHPKGQVNVWGDEFKVEEVVTNYLTNALNHLNQERTIEITCEVLENVVRTTVFNTGDPIPAEDLDKIWIKFYKVDKARTREYGGSGIGLSIVKAIMDSMHQECGATNYENGVAFWFTLESV